MQGVSRADVERMLWRVSGWRADQWGVDQVLLVADGYAASTAAGALDIETENLYVAMSPAQRAEVQAIISGTARCGSPECPSNGPDPLPAAITPASPCEAQTASSTGRDGGEQRTCRGCGRDFPLTYFRIDNHKSGARRWDCRGCEALTRWQRHERSAA